MKKPRRSAWTRGFAALGRQAMQAGSSALVRALRQAAKAAAKPRAQPKAKTGAKPKAPARALPRSASRSLPRSPGLALGLKSPAVRAAAPATGRWTPGVALGPAGARRYRLYSPPGLLPGERLPVVVMLHGCTQDADGFAASTRMNRLAAVERFLVLYPEQDRIANPQGCWNWYDTDHGRAQGEADLVLQAVDQVCRSQCGDAGRVLLAGLSAGASLAALLAVRHPARFCGVVMHSGIPPGAAHSTLTALRAMRGRRATVPLGAMPAAGWPPLLVIHGSADGVVSPHNGVVAAQAWADAAGALAGAPRRVQRGQRLAMLVTVYKHRGRTAATLAMVQGLAHAWSGGAAGQPFSDLQGPDASRMVWAFAQRQFRRLAA